MKKEIENVSDKKSFADFPVILLIFYAVIVLLFDSNMLRAHVTALMCAFAIFIILITKASSRKHFIKSNLLRQAENYLDLARRHSRFRLTEEGERYYRKSVRKFYQAGAIVCAIDAFSEYFDLYENVFEPRFQLRICRELYRRSHYELSAKALETLIENRGERSWEGDTIWKEKAYIRLARMLAEKLDCLEYAAYFFTKFIKEFPESRFREIAGYQIMAIEAKKAQKRLKMAI